MRTKNNILLITTIFFMLNTVNAQFFAEINTGYAAPFHSLPKGIYKTRHSNYYRYYDNTQEIDTSYFKPNKKFNMGNEAFIDGAIGYKLNNKWSFSINVMYLNNYDYNIFYKPFSSEMVIKTFFFEEERYSICPNSFTWNRKYIFYGERFSLIPKVSYFLEKNKFRFETSVGISLSYLTLYRNIESDSESITSNIFGKSHRITSEIWKEYYTKNNHVGAYMALSTYYQLTDKIELKLSAELNGLLDFHVATGTQYYYERYYEYNGNIIEHTIDTELYEVNAPDFTKEYYNFSTINFSLGVRYYFR